MRTYTGECPNCGDFVLFTLSIEGVVQYKNGDPSNAQVTCEIYSKTDHVCPITPPDFIGETLGEVER